MKRFLELILQLQKKGYYLESVEYTDLDYYILCFKKDGQKYLCMVSQFSLSYEANMDEEIKIILRNIHSVLQHM